MKELDVMWNNGLDAFNFCWTESVRPLQYFCCSLLFVYLKRQDS